MVIVCVGIIGSIFFLSVFFVLCHVRRVGGGDVGLVANILLAMRLGEGRIGKTRS